MGQSISSVTDMVSYAGALRRAVQQAPTPETAQKIQRSTAGRKRPPSPPSGGGETQSSAAVEKSEQSRPMREVL